MKGFEAGNLSNEIWNGTGITNTTGAFVITGLTPGTYDIGIKNRTCISELQTNVVLSSIAVVNFGNTREGDVKLTDKVDGFDYSLLSAAYNARPDDGNWDVNADLNRSGKVDGFDYSLLSGNYNVRVSAYGYF